MGVLATIAAVAIILYSFAAVGYANPSYTAASAGTAAATSTLTYLTPGTATTTEVWDAGAATGPLTDQGALLVQLTGSSTATVLNIAFEYAQYVGVDCKVNPTGCDWYNDRYFTSASTTQAFNLNVANTYTWSFSSTSVSGGVIGTTAVNKRIIGVQTPTRYVRAVLSIPAGALNGAVWAQFIGKKEGK